MRSNVCSIFGHSEFIITSDIEEKLTNALEICINILNIYTFYVGGYGDFDKLSTYVLNKLKIKYPQIKIILVYAYLNNNLHNSDKIFINEHYDCTIYPNIEHIPKRYAIIERNKWIVKESSFIIFFVKHSWGGASKMLDYAKKKKIPFINIA